jgi:hypothetical protein
MFVQLAVCALGVLLTASPALFGYGGPAATRQQVVGPVLASLACIAASEVTRPLRFANVVLGLWLLAAPWILAAPTPALIIASAVGALAIVLSTLGGAVEHRYGGGWSALWREPKQLESPRLRSMKRRPLERSEGSRSRP